MAEWKKVIVSGSNADLAEVTASGGFIGDGSAITGLVEASLANDAVTNAKLANITRGSVKVGGASNAPTDLAAKTSGQILVGDGTDIVSVAVSGDVTLAANGAVTIANTAVENAMIGDGAVDTEEIAANAVTTAKITDANVTLAKIANAAANTVIVRDANSSGVLSAKAVTNTQILIGDGTGFTAAALSSDVTMTNGGAVTIANNAVSLAKMAGLARGKLIVGDSSGDPSALAAGGANTVLQSDGTDITYNTVATAMIADNAVDGDKLADSFTVANSVAAKNFTASMGVSASHFSASTDIIASGNIITTSGSFVGSGAELTGITVDIDGLSAVTTPHQTQDHFIISDNGTEKKITFSNVEDAIFGNVSGDATVAAGGALTIANTAVETAMIADDAVDADKLAANAVVNASIASNAAIAHSKLAALAATKVLVGNGSNVATEVALSGDVTMDNAGAVTIGTGVVEHAMLAADAVDGDNIGDDVINSEHYVAASIDNEHLADNAVDTAEIADNAVTLAKMAGLARGKIIHGDSSGNPAALAVGGANTVLQSDGTDISYNTIATAMIADNAVDGDKLANDITIANDLTVTRDLIVNGTSVTVNTANLNVEDPFILLKSGSSNTSDSGVIFGGSTGTANTGKALIWDASYNSNDGRLAVSTTAVAGDATANFDGSGTAGYYIAGVFAGSEADAATAKADHAGNIRIESSEIYIYV